jgi:hypothetical protein
MNKNLFMVREYTYPLPLRFNEFNMKKIVFALLLLASMQVSAQALKVPVTSPLQTVKQQFALSDISVEYGRPGARSRTVFGDVVPYGKIWRTGANGATKITFGDDVTIEGKVVKAGTYALYTIPNANEWTIMLYNDLKLGGDVSNYKTENEVMRFTAKPRLQKDAVETFTIDMQNILPTSMQIDLVWQNTRVGFTVNTDIDERIMKNIQSSVEKDNRPYYQAASYYYDNNKDLTKALEWVSKATEQNPDAYWIWTKKAQIQAKMGDKKGAVLTATKAGELAKADGDDAYQRITRQIIEENSKK